MGEKNGTSKRTPQYGKLRTRNANARDFARQLRQQSTDAEKRLWRLLRDRRFNEFKFRRQYPYGVYFLDFYCALAKLAVELDGGGHGFPDQRARDEKRNKFLTEQGIKTLRFWNHQMRGELEAIRFEIWYALMERTGRREEIAGYLPKPAATNRANARARRPLTLTLSPDGGEGTGAGVIKPNSPATVLRASSPLVGEREHRCAEAAPSPRPSPPMGERESKSRAEV